ncbi:restriction endonuclease subunit S [Pseudomonas proteolytica]|uniref:restriction endonuclease subunit S n=1 Tax=Pseudomonas proteolytica TaxID=219574 RepID=UPI0030EC8351
MSELPLAWIRTTLGQVVSYADNETVDPADMPPETWLLELEDIERDSGKVLERKTVGARAPKSTKNRFHAGDVLYGKLRPYLNKVVRAGQDGLCSSEIIAISPGQLDQNYLFYSMRSPTFIEYVSSASHGMRMPRLGTQQAKSAPFVLPALAEQTHIAQKLDELLGKVDTLKARVDSIPTLLKNFRQSVLAAAVSGRLTKGWRSIARIEEPQVCWRSVKLGELCTLVTSGSRGWADYYSDTGAVFIRSQDISTDELVLTDTAFVTLPESSEGKRTKVQTQDIFITITGANVGKVARVKQNLPEAYVSQHVALVRLKEQELATFIELYLKDISSGRGELTKLAYGGGKPGLNLSNIRELVLLIPPVDEQAEIIRRVEKLFVLADQMEANITRAKHRIDRLPQSLLSKAFSGELTADWRTANPDLISGKKSAEALLEKIKHEREVSQHKHKARNKS